MSTVGITAAQARHQAEAEHAARRDREAACRLAYLVYGDTFMDQDGEPTAHANVCVCDPACSRNYDPLPYAEAEPVDLRLYEGTPIAALYGHGPLEPYVARLAGWNLTPRSDRHE